MKPWQIPEHLRMSKAAKFQHDRRTTIKLIGDSMYKKTKRQVAAHRRHIAPGELAVCRKCGRRAPYDVKHFYPRMGHLCLQCGRLKLRHDAAKRRAIQLAKSLGYKLPSD